MMSECIYGLFTYIFTKFQSKAHCSSSLLYHVSPLRLCLLLSLDYNSVQCSPYKNDKQQIYGIRASFVIGGGEMIQYVNENLGNHARC